MNKLPKPPVLKTTIIQLNTDLDATNKNFEILTNEYTTNGVGENTSEITENPQQELITPNMKKKRRRLSSNIDSEEIIKRRNETKQLHSIIEKRRRMKINREFEELKYLIPACRSTNNITGSGKAKAGVNNNSNKIDGMHKLTILQSSVEYIMYLHHIIQEQHKLLQSNPCYDFDIKFSKIPLDVNSYRDIGKEFNFNDLSTDYSTNSRKVETSLNSSDKESSTEYVKEQLPSPDITPDIAPVLTALNDYRSTKKLSRHHSLPSIPYRDNFSDSNIQYTNFYLPDPALTLAVVPRDQVEGLSLPERKFFKKKVPLNNKIVYQEAGDNAVLEQDASKTLLALRKANINNLLN